MTRSSTSSIALLALACARAPAENPRLGPAPPPPIPATPAPAPPSPEFQNPGGLWLPEQIPTHAETLRRLGLRIDPALLSDPLSGVLGAIVNLGGCSASFVSPDGLVVTNHHCAVGALQYNSTPEANLLEAGFLAKSPSDERWSGPSARLSVTRALRDVTAAVTEQLSGITDDLARQRALERFDKQAVATCERERPSVRCELKSFYGGLRYYLIERMELRDVRLVYAPPAGIGNYGGEVDNWRWPRHVGDFTFFRGYVDGQGNPAEHQASNVPYRPPHHLKLARKPLAPGDLVIAAGYPAKTSMLEVLKEVEETVHWTYPRRLAAFDAYIAAIEQVAAEDKDAAIKGAGWLRGFSNYRTKHKGELQGLEQGRLIEQKRAEGQALRKLVPETVQGIDLAISERDRTRERDTALTFEILMPRLMWAATQLVRVAEERTKPDADRDPDYQERKLVDLRGELDQLDRRYHPKLDRALLVLALTRVLATEPALRTPALELLAGKQPTPESIRQTVARLYAGTKLGDAKRRRELFERATPGQLAQSRDPLIRAAVTLRPLLREIEERNDRFQGKLLRESPVYMAKLLELKGGHVAPDANRTLRLSYGTVKRLPSGEGSAFTLLSEVVRKHRNKEPFDAPDALLAAVQQGRLGPYRVADLGDVPVNFLSDVQSTNGNSGSATLDAEGKLTGLLFDGTFESVASDWVFLPQTRTIHVDVRYMLWVMDAVSNADWLLRELGVTVRVPR